MYFDVTLINFVCLFQYFIFISKFKYALFFYFLRELLQVHNGKYTEGVTGFTQFHVLNISISLLLTSSTNDSFCSSLNNSLPMDVEKTCLTGTLKISSSQLRLLSLKKIKKTLHICAKFQ